MSSRRNSPCAPNPRRTERGSAVITVLVLAAVTAVIAAGFLFRSAQEAKLASRSYFQAVALNLAEAGLEEGLYAANTASLTSANGWTLVSGSTTDYRKTITADLDFTQAAGAIYIRADGATGATPAITAAGVVTLAGQPKIVKQLRVSGSGPRKLFANGVVARGNVTFTGSAYIDSYDSALGNWNSSSNRSDRATVATTGTVQLTGSAYIYGSVATSGSVPSIGGSGRIYGAVSPSSPLIDASRVRTDFNANLTDATAPTGTAISLGAYSVAGSSSATLPRLLDVPGPNGRYLYTCTSFTVGGSGYVRITGPVDIIVTGNVSVGGSGYIAVGGGVSVNPSLNLYSPGTIDIGGSGMVNNTNVPLKTTIWGTKPAGGTLQTITVGGSGEYKGTVYAPNGNITISGSGGLSGAAIGHTVTVSGSGEIHYDVQLLNATVSGGPNPGTGAASSGTIAVGAWSELADAAGSGSAFARDNRAPFDALF